MHIHILGIGGTFMAGLATLAQQLGHRVSGSDTALYPPMSDLLAAQGITAMEGYRAEHLDPEPDCIVVGNAIVRGNPALEHILDRGLPFTSGPAWLAEHVLPERWVLAAAGTHGKTTTSSMLCWILEYAGLSPGFLVGGVPENFGVSARLGDTAFFVVEADEYDSAFSDKRSKFVHYRPRTLILNNLEFDHADIFPDIEAIRRQFHHLVRTVPSNGLIVVPADDAELTRVLQMGCWTPTETLGIAAGAWRARPTRADGSRFEVLHEGAVEGAVEWPLIGDHNVLNALAAIIAARHVGVTVEHACAALGEFKNVKRRMEVRGTVNGITVYDDFAHHPTAIATTLAGLRARVGAARIIAILEPRSNTMRAGVHRDTLGPALGQADAVWIQRPSDIDWDLESAVAGFGANAHVCTEVDDIVRDVATNAAPGDHLLVMSNAAFGGIHQELIEALQTRYA